MAAVKAHRFSLSAIEASEEIESTTRSKDLETGGESGPFGLLAVALGGARLVSDALAGQPHRSRPRGS